MAALLLAALISPRSTANEVAVELRGSLILPAEAPDAAGMAAPVVGLSGIAWTGDDRYLSVMDNSRSMLSFRLEGSATGRPISAARTEPAFRSKHASFHADNLMGPRPEINCRPQKKASCPCTTQAPRAWQ